MAHRRHEQIGVAVVVDVGERTGNRDGVLHAEACLVGDILEPAVSPIPPQLAAAELGNEEQVRPPVVVDVGGAQPGPVVVVDLLVGLASVVDDTGLERDAARLPLVGEAKVVQHLRSCGQGRLLAGACEQPGARRACGACGAVGPAGE